MFDAAPPPTPPLFMVERASDHQSAVFMGFLAVGDEAAKVRLEAAAKAAGFKTARAKNRQQQDEVMVFFPATCEHARCMSFYHDARQGKYGKFAIEVMLIAKSSLDDGFQAETDVRIFPPSQIVETTRP